jgi:DNA-binding NtrC family response regulator
MSKLLVIDDEPNIVFTVEETLTSPELQVISAGTAREGIDLARSQRPDVVLLDVRLPDMSGLDAFSQIHSVDPRIPVIIMTAFARTETAIDAMRRGAFEYLVKPVDLQALKQAVRRGIEVSRLSNFPALLNGSSAPEEDELNADRIVGQSPAMQDVYKTIGRVAPQDATVLILGESGTGKELVARAIYHYSGRSHKPFLTINCAALAESLLESELFGHEKGAFTGADQRRIGKFEQVNGGTIFLDEIGDMSPSTQAKALRLLQQQQFERVGGNATIQTDVRIIAATNQDLPAMVAAGSFRQDLYYRLSGFTIHLPPLRERREDIAPLCAYFVRILSKSLGKSVRGLTKEVESLLERHTWPGNVRELYSAIRYAVVHSTGDFITPDCLPRSCLPDRPENPALSSLSPGGLKPLTPATLPAAAPSELVKPNCLLPDVQRRTLAQLEAGSNDVYRDLLHEFDQVVLEEVLKSVHGNQVQAAERLGISRMTLRSKLRSFHRDRGEAETHGDHE